ncbi:MAG: hypothetical protein AB7Q16_11285 [Vicinamibacterales bacterium]
MRPFILLAALTASGAAALAVAPSPQKADLFELKLSNVMARGVAAEPTGYRTEFADDEVNAYLQLRLAQRFPAGVADPSVTLVGQGRLSARAIVDLDGLRKKSSGGWFDPAAYLAGRLPVTATGTLKTANGRGQLQLESAEVSGIPVPLTLLQELVTYYTKSPDLPTGVNLNEPFDLPSKIQRIDVDPGRAVVVQ